MSDESASKMKLRVVDLCAGLGGFHQGIHEFFENKAWEQTNFGAEWSGYECVLASELNEVLREKYVENHKPSLNYEYYSKHFTAAEDPKVDSEDIDKSIGDVYEVNLENDNKPRLKSIHGDMSLLVDEEVDNNFKDAVTARLNEIEEGLNLKEHKQAYLERFQKGTVRKWLDKEDEDYVIPEFDMLCAGFPCQPFSQSGKQQGFDDERGNVWNMIRIILQTRQPKYVFLENVPNFQSHDNGNTLDRVLDELLILGYKVDYKVWSPQDIGEPQTRKRFFIVGERTDKKILPFSRKPKRPEQEKTALSIIRENPESETKSSSKIPNTALNAINHWQILLNMVHAYNQWPERPDSLDTIILPGFPIWGYELDPKHFYPPSYLVSKTEFKKQQTKSPETYKRYLRDLNEEREKQLKKYANSTIDLRTFYGIPLDDEWSHDKWTKWLEADDKKNTRPTYTKNDKGWNPQSKSQYDKKQFIERVRKWAVQNLFGKIATKAFNAYIRNNQESYDFIFTSDEHSRLFGFSFVDIDTDCKKNYPQLEKHHRWLRWWLDKLEGFPHSYQKLELTIGEKERKKHVRLYGEYLLQTRPSGIRVKDPSAIPTLVAQGDSQVPIYSEYNSEDPEQKLSDVFKKISVSAQLAFQGFPKDFTKGLSPSAASKALGNAVNVKLITAILELWLLPENSVDDVDSEEQPVTLKSSNNQLFVDLAE